MGGTEDRYELHVEGDPTGLSTIRVFVRAVARSVDADAERIDDLQLIVSEVCSELLESGGSALDLTVWPQPEGFEVSVEAAGAAVATDGPTDGQDNAFRRELLRSLSPDTTWSDGGARFRVAVPAGAERAQQA